MTTPPADVRPRVRRAAVATRGVADDASSASISSCDRILLTTSRLRQAERLAQQRAQARHRQRAQLRHARLADADDLADFGERQLFFVIERQNLALALGQLLEWPAPGARAAPCVRAVRRRSPRIDAQLDERRAVRRSARRADAIGADLERAQLFERLLVLPRASCPSRRRFPASSGSRPRRCAQACRSPLSTSRRMRRSERGAQSRSRSASSIAPCTRRRANASNGTPRRRLVAAGRVDQAEHADADQVVHLDLRRAGAAPAAAPGVLTSADVLHHELGRGALEVGRPAAPHAQCEQPPLRPSATGTSPHGASRRPPRRADRVRPAASARIRKQRLAGDCGR